MGEVYRLGASSKPPIRFLQAQVVGLANGFYTVSTVYGTYSNVPSCVGQCNPGDSVTIMFLDPVHLRNPQIIQNHSKVISEQNYIDLIQAFALWSQAEGNCRLSNSIDSPLIFTNGFNTLVTMTFSLAAQPLGLAVNADSVMVSVFPVRDSGNTFWEKLVITLIQANTLIPDNSELLISSSPAGWGRRDGVWINGDASYVIAAEYDLKQLFRRRLTAWEQISLTGIGSLSVDGINVSPNGPLLLPQCNFAWPTYIAANGSSAGVLGSQDNSGAEKIRCWDPKAVAATTIPQAWELNPASVFSSGRIINGKLPDRCPCSLDLVSFVCWFSGREVIPFDSRENKSLLTGYNPALNLSNPIGLDTSFSRSLEAKIVGISTASGIVSWSHTITWPSVAAIADSGLLDPLTTWFTSNVPPTGPSVTNYCSGRYVQNQVASDDDLPIGLGRNNLNQGPFGFSGAGGFLQPQHNYFRDESLVVLPLLTSNTAQPRDVLGQLNNTAAFLDYGKDPASQGIIQTNGVVLDSSGNAYLAYLAPVPVLLSGRAIYATDTGGGIASLGITNFPDLAILELETQSMGISNFRGQHLPDMYYMRKRFLRKVSPVGVLLAELDLTQLATVSWWEDEITLGNPFGVAPIGGDSVGTFPLADNVWQIVPAGRVVFVIIDYHDLGPNYYPATKLIILNSANLAVLHTIELRLNENLIPSDILDGSSNVVFRAGEREYSVTTARCKAGAIDPASEFAAVWVSQERRDGEIPSFVARRLFRILIGSVIAAPPTITSVINDTDPISAAIVDGKTLDINFNGSTWNIRQMV